MVHTKVEVKIWNINSTKIHQSRIDSAHLEQLRFEIALAANTTTQEVDILALDVNGSRFNPDLSNNWDEHTGLRFDVLVVTNSNRRNLKTDTKAAIDTFVQNIGLEGSLDKIVIDVKLPKHVSGF